MIRRKTEKRTREDGAAVAVGVGVVVDAVDAVDDIAADVEQVDLLCPSRP